MITYDEAFRIVLETARRLPVAHVPLDETLGLVLAETVLSPLDLPAFDRSAMDGYALRSADATTSPVELAVVEELPAGRAIDRVIASGQCAKIMTGAPVPEGADAVIRIEETEPAGAGRVRLLRSVAAGANICVRGEDLRRGSLAMSAGRTIRPQEMALLAALGLSRVPVFRRPQVAVLSTGAEVVPVDRDLGLGQIRDANSHTLAARLLGEGIRADRLGIAPDEKPALRAALGAGLDRDLLLVSGGVSMGDFDLVPAVLRDLGVEILFEKIAIRPGMPTVFGRRDRSLVFGLPGNPVAAPVVAELLVVPCVRQLMGRQELGPQQVPAILSGTLSHKAERTSYVPVTLSRENAARVATPIEFHGSGDLVGLSNADGFAVLPASVKSIGDGAKVAVIVLAGAPWGP